MKMSRDQNAGQNRNIQRGTKSFETVEQIKTRECLLSFCAECFAEFRVCVVSVR
jgi:hypothetical protein